MVQGWHGLESDHGCYSIDGKNLNVMEQPELLKHYVSEIRALDAIVAVVRFFICRYPVTRIGYSKFMDLTCEPTPVYYW
eukprot:SAG11_NODE_4_length_33019_cov_28.098909_5_plen_79_part_00